MNTHLKNILKKIYYFPGYLINIPTFLFQRVRLPKSIECIGKTHIINEGKIKLGESIRIRSGVLANPIGIGTKTIFHVIQGGELTIGNNVRMSNTGICCAKKITIEDGVMIGGGVCIWDTDFHSCNYNIRLRISSEKERPRTREIIIEKGVFIGAGSIILKGSHIGMFSIVGAGSVVSGKIPPQEVWAGNPAKFIRKLTIEELS
ncbi:MAG: acyltransferase [Phocaeicola sp.]|uniref:acyltransferase n=1 Tax=Phocaeicola TaxID=909656 RepID=UPI00234EFC07|nr:acyltransferase [Phocaeicola oris]MCE2615607.1 acyltransferase [Phocaeicola oris]